MPLEEYRAFVRVVEDGSFTAAARSLGTSKSFVSKRLSRLEDRLGVQLLNRTTRQVMVTPEGEQFYERVASILRLVDDAEAEISAAQAAPQGTLKVSLPMSFGLRYLSPLVAEFIEAHPGVDIECDYSDRKVDVVAEGYDVAVRIGELADSSLIARKLAPTIGGVFAAPSYLKKHGYPANPSELADHECLLYSYSSASHAQTWTLQAQVGGTATVRVHGRLLANAGEALRDAAVAGRGIALFPDFLVVEQVRSGALVRVLPEWRLYDGAIWALFPQNRYVSATVRSFVDFLREHLERTWGLGEDE